MNKLLLIFRNFCVVFALLIFFSCGETIPTIIFTTPQNNQKYFKNEDIEVKIILADTKGKTFPVQLYVDGIFIEELANSPYFFQIQAGAILPGKHTIKVTTTGAEALVTITIKDANYESDDFVTFANGIIPPEWTVNEWYIDERNGVDDNFSLSTMEKKATVSANKKCGKISFYMKGYATVNLYNGTSNNVWQTIDLPSNSPQEWKLYEFDFIRASYTFTWELVQGLAFLDAIRFEN